MENISVFGSAQLVSAYSLSQNIIESAKTSWTPFTDRISRMSPIYLFLLVKFSSTYSTDKICLNYLLVWAFGFSWSLPILCRDMWPVRCNAQLLFTLLVFFLLCYEIFKINDDVCCFLVLFITATNYSH